jgi:N-carbamoylputrescine amidase
LLQELFRSQYFCQTEDIQLFKLLKRFRSINEASVSGAAKKVVISSLLRSALPGRITTRRHDRRSGKIAGKYRKMHIPDDPLLLREVLFHTRRF